MAASPLFDLAELDLTQVAVSWQRVGEINPQAGHMRQLDHLIWLTDDFSYALGVKHVRDDEFWVPGHVPGRPLLPGVLMIEAAAQLCSLTERLRPEMNADTFIGFIRCDDVIFRGQVVPGDTLYLLAKLLSHRPRRFTSAAQGIVNGNLVFEAKITGMVM